MRHNEHDDSMNATRRARPGRLRQFVSGSSLALALLIGAAGGLAGASQAEQGPATPVSVQAIVLPGERVFPEGVACDPATGDYFVGSTADGAIFRGTIGSGETEAEIFLPGGEDGREAVTGVKLDAQGRLFVAGRRTGRVFVYDAATGTLIAALATPSAERTLINDLADTNDAAYVTDSFRPILFRVPLTDDGVGDPEPWLDLRDTTIPNGAGFNLNGIAATADGRYLLTVHYDAGTLYRIDTRDKSVIQVDLGADDALATGDGILLKDDILYVVLGGPGEIVPVRLAADLASGEVGTAFADPSFRAPTTIADCGDGRLLVVNSQLNMEGGGGTPELPFTLSSIPIP